MSYAHSLEIPAKGLLSIIYPVRISLCLCFTCGTISRNCAFCLLRCKPISDRPLFSVSNPLHPTLSYPHFQPDYLHDFTTTNELLLRDHSSEILWLFPCLFILPPFFDRMYLKLSEFYHCIRNGPINSNPC